MAGYRSQSRPDSVPVLNFGQLEAEDTLQKPAKAAQRLTTPDSRSTISWGTPISSPYHVSKKDLMLGNNIHRPCTHIRHKGAANVNINNNQRHTEMDEKGQGSAVYQSIKSGDNQMKSVNTNVKHVQIAEKPTAAMSTTITEPQHSQNKSKDMKKGKESYWYLDRELRENPPTPRVDSGPTIDDIAHMQASFTAHSYTDIHSARKMAAEDDTTSKQKKQVMEQVLSDLLSRHVISDPEQDRDPARSNPADPLKMPPGVAVPPLRLRSRRLHDTKVSTLGATTETNLQSRVTFSARILTRNGRDSLRELFGFFFSHDQTITVYEYRFFGKKNFKALPFISRGKYKHQNGRRKGKEMNQNDIEFEKNLSFLTKSQSHFPESLKKQPILTIRITNVDGDAPSSTQWQMSTDDRDLDSDGFREKKDRQIVKKIQAFVRQKLRLRSVSVLMGLGKMFRTMDRSGDGLLCKRELSEALLQFDIQIPQEDFEAVWRVVDENADGAIDYGEFMRAFIGEMSEYRKQIVQKVFRNVDPRKTGSASLLDMKKMYSAKLHPLVLSGEISQEEIEIRFIDSFSNGFASEPGRVSYVEFEEYYEGLSIIIVSDNDFVNMMRNCWGV